MTLHAKSLFDVLAHHTEQDPDGLQYRYLRKGELENPELLTRSQLLQKASALGSLLAQEAAPGDRVLLLYPPGLDIFVSFFACQHAELIAVPMTPPDPSRIQQTLPRLLGIIEQSGVKLILSTSAVVDAAQAFLSELPGMSSLRWIASDEALRKNPTGGQARAQRPDAVAFLQYTSGSLGAPKGVTVTNGALLANLEMIKVGMAMGPETPGAFWLPHYHDMGFIGGGLEFVYCKSNVTMMSPLAFIQKPVRWLRAISTFGSFVGGGPCFGYERCVRKVTDEEMEGLDLSSWRVAFIGAEPVRANVLERFAKRFERSKFRREFFYPCYGLAESTLYVSGKPMEPTPEIPKVLTLSAKALEQDKVELAEPSADARTFVSCGAPRLESKIAIVSRDKTLAKPGEIGEIWIKGPNLALGYWNNPETTQASFGLFLQDTHEGPFHATGDLGFMQDGELYVTGRAKELLILGGRNQYPLDLEETIEASHPDLRYGCSAAFSIDTDEEEVLVVTAEITQDRINAEEKTKTQYQDISNAIRLALLKKHSVVPKEVVFLPPQGLTKTTSGKKARLEMRRRFLSRDLEPA